MRLSWVDFYSYIDIFVHNAHTRICKYGCKDVVKSILKWDIWFHLAPIVPQILMN